jgi:PAS domain S-box-containing protein
MQTGDIPATSSLSRAEDIKTFIPGDAGEERKSHFPGQYTSRQIYTYNGQILHIMEFSVPEQWAGIWGSIQAGIILVDAETHTILAANPEAERMTGYAEHEMTGHLCHKFICPAEQGKCPISDLKMKVDRAERVLLAKDGKKVPVLKTVTEMEVSGRRCFIETFIDISPLKDAENTLLAYIREATLRIRNPVELVRDNLQELKDELKGRDRNPAYIGTVLTIQQKNMDDILNNLQEIERAVAEKRTEIPDALREYLKR